MSSNRFTSNDFAAIVPTNGRSTFTYAERFLNDQTVRVPVRVFRNSLIPVVMSHTLKTSKRRFLLKVDDDIWLHPRMVEYALKCVNRDFTPMTGLFYYLLWEDWSKEVVQSIKVYNLDVARKIGFAPDEQGRIDHIFLNRLKNRKFTIKAYNDIVGVHSCGTKAESEKYLKLWRDNSKRKIHVKVKYDKMIAYDVPVSIQHQNAVTQVEDINAKLDTEFHKWLHA